MIVRLLGLPDSIHCNKLASGENRRLSFLSTVISKIVDKNWCAIIDSAVCTFLVAEQEKYQKKSAKGALMLVAPAPEPPPLETPGAHYLSAEHLNGQDLLHSASYTKADCSTTSALPIAMSDTAQLLPFKQKIGTFFA